ncbi:MAG: hypothetical protein RR988_00960 [Clostridia bacterium]
MCINYSNKEKDTKQLLVPNYLSEEEILKWIQPYKEDGYEVYAMYDHSSDEDVVVLTNDVVLVLVPTAILEDKAQIKRDYMDKYIDQGYKLIDILDYTLDYYLYKFIRN